MALLLFDGTDIHDRTGIFLDLMSGFFESASARGSDTIVPSLEGRIARARVKDVRRLVLTGYVTGTSAADYGANALAAGALFDPSADPAALVINDGYLGVGSGQSIDCRVVNVVTGDPLYAVVYQTWSVELEAIGPDWSS